MPDNRERDARWFAERMPSREVLAEVLSGDPVTRLMNVARDRAIANGGLVPMPKGDADDAAVAAALQLATDAAKRLSEGGDHIVLSDDEKAALDLFILLVARPAIFVRRGKVAERPKNWPEIGEGEEVLPPIIAGVGRIESASHVKKGTGFIVGDRRILTNNHVLCALFGMPADKWKTDPATFAERCTAAGNAWSQNTAAAPVFELHGELGSTASAQARITRVLGHHADVDMAVLELDVIPAGGERVPLMNEEPKQFLGRRVFAVGYPVADTVDGWGNRAPAPVFQRVFGADPASLGTKRFSPGIILEWGGERMFNHDASTLPGSSGSCIVDFELRKAVGLHYSGAYTLKKNFAVPLWKYRQDAVLKNNGVVFD